MHGPERPQFPSAFLLWCCLPPAPSIGLFTWLSALRDGLHVFYIGAAAEAPICMRA
jgi:hypothetical protein